MSGLRQRELAAIHIRAKERGLGEEDYRALLFEVAGVRSAAALDGRGRRRVLDRLAPRPRSPRSRGRSPSPDPLVRKVYAQLGDRPPSYAVGILRRMFGSAAPAAIEWATGEQLRKVVAALDYDARRRAKRG